MVKNIFTLLFIVILTSCYTHKITLNPDKNSGQMIIEYNLDDDYFQLVSIAVENFSKSSDDKFDPAALLDENLFKSTFKENEGYKLNSIKIEKIKNNEDILIYKGKVIIDFYDLEKILGNLPKGLTNLEFKKTPNEITLSQIINLQEMDPNDVFKDFINQQKEDDIKFYNRLMHEAKFSFIVNTSTPIKNSEGVVLSGDKKSAQYTFKLSEFVNSEGKILKFLISL